MSTFGTLKTEIASDVERTLADDAMSGETWDDVIGRYINDAIKLLRSKHWWFLQKPSTGTYTSTTTASNQYVSEYTGLVRLDSLRITSAGQLQELTEVPFQQMEANYDGNPTESEPIEYARWGGRIRLYPEPDDAYTLTWSGLFELDALTVDADTNAWCTHGSVVVKAQAKVKLYRDYIKDMEGAATASAELAEGIMALNREHARRVGTSKISARC
jgi:hypothetical protein